jgi:hypothetical protein
VNRPLATIVLALVSAIAALASFVVTLQFLEVLPWGEDDFDFWGGKWAGVFLFGLVTFLACLVCYGWLTLKPWAFTITILMALIGLSIPISALAAGTETWSTALLPILVNVGILLLVLSKGVRRATSASAVRSRPAPVPVRVALRADDI